MWKINELKEKGRTAFKANYWTCVLMAFLLSILTGYAAVASGSGGEDAEVISQSFRNLPPGVMVAVAGILAGFIIIGILVKIFLVNPLSVGCYASFIENIDHPVKLEVIKKGFRNFKNVFITLFLRDLFLALWTLLLIVPGLVKTYSYRMVPYILAEDPNTPPMECIRRSREMMKGNKWNAFVLDLSFLGWNILSVLTLGILGIFWTRPYKESTNAALYLTLC